MPLTAEDRLLLKRCLNEEQGAWREFVDRYLGLIYHVIQHTADLHGMRLRPEETEDAAADVMAQIVAKNYAVLRNFKGKSSLAAYLTVIARRMCVHRLAGADGVAEVTAPEPIANHVAEAPAPAADQSADLDNAEEVQRLLAKLPPRDRQVVRMFYIEGKTYDEIAEDLGIPRNSIGPILTRAKQQLRQDTAS